MADPAATATDEIIERIEQRLKVEYGQAEREIKQKLDAYFKRFETKDKIWQRWVADGKKTEAEYREWKIGQMAVGERWTEMRDTIAKDLQNTDKIARSIARGYAPEVYALNHDYGTFQVERGSLVDTSYTLYSRQAAERLMRDDPDLLPEPGKRTSQMIAEGRADRWNKQHIQSVAMQAILQGNSIPDIATRLANAVGDSNRKAAVRNARTMMTYAQNSGRLDAYRRANDMGIKTRKQWLATLDSRTRHAHRELDGQVRDLDEPFENSIGQIDCPGDPSADGANVYNCRCTMLSVIKGHEIDVTDMGLRRDDKLDGMSYDEWLEGKEQSNPILQPEETSDSIRAGYIRDYRGYGGPVASGRDNSLDIDYRGDTTSQRPGEAEGQPEGIRGQRGQMDTGYHGVVPREDMDEYNANALKQIMQDTGYTEDEARRAQEAFSDYCGGDYEEYAAGNKQREVQILDDALSRMPTYSGSVYRGMSFDDEDESDVFNAFADLKSGDSISMRSVSSWTSKHDAADRFAQLDDVGRNSVIFECGENKTGVGIQHISRMGDYEAEVMAPSSSEWTVQGVQRMSKYDYADTVLNDRLKAATDPEERKSIRDQQNKIFERGDIMKWYDVVIVNVGE